MKKILILFTSFILAAALIAGCSKVSGKVGIKNKNTSIKTKPNAAALVKKDVNSITDNDLLSIAMDKNENITMQDDLDVDKDISDIDSVLDSKDNLSDIPSNVDLK